MSALEIEPAMTYRLQVRGPLTSTDGSAPHPHVEYWEMAGATLDGPEIHATSAMPGIDWFRPSADGWGRPHVRLPFRTDDGALVLLDYRGSCTPRTRSCGPWTRTWRPSGPTSTCA